MPSYATMVTNVKGGNMLTLRTFTNTLDDFDEKQSLTARRRWWEKFLNMTIQAGWTEQMKIYEFKTKMSPAARNWMGQLGKRVRTNWGRLAREFKREYCKSRDDEGADIEQSAEVEQDVDEDDAPLRELAAAIQDAQISDNPNGAFLSREELIHEVYRIMNNVGWKPANPNARSGQ
ncbi:hypothetical protein PHMEG_00030266, partial [Phytophthora megakarya]